MQNEHLKRKSLNYLKLICLPLLVIAKELSLTLLVKGYK
jgi:hypothetical protein